jgi:hypothetical protein
VEPERRADLARLSLSSLFLLLSVHSERICCVQRLAGLSECDEIVKRGKENKSALKAEINTSTALCTLHKVSDLQLL